MEPVPDSGRDDVMASSLDVIVFPGGFNLPIWAGIHCGAFAAQDLEIRLHFTTNSMQQLVGLVRGEWQIGLTGFDNVVAYQEGQGEAELDREPDLFVFMGGDNAFLRLVVQSDIRGYADLLGKTLSVDALTTGFAFVLRKMLALNGIVEADVRFERAGGALQRFEALQAGRHAGTRGRPARSWSAQRAVSSPERGSTRAASKRCLPCAANTPGRGNRSPICASTTT
jgi:ABC-type nitrate/sulfonate/bicarbonate transport system substrate-binding protein